MSFNQLISSMLYSSSLGNAYAWAFAESLETVVIATLPLYPGQIMDKANIVLATFAEASVIGTHANPAACTRNLTALYMKDNRDRLRK